MWYFLNTFQMITKTFINKLAYRIIGCAIEVHKHMGPGLLESIYEACMLEEMRTQGIIAQTQIYVPVVYKQNR
jgi:GxxExxY protein